MTGMFEAAIAWLGLKFPAVIGGFFGALGSLRLFPGLSFWGSCSTFLFGWAAAAFLAPLIASWINAGPEHLASMGFLTGLFSLACAYQTIKAMPDWVAAFRTRFLGSKGDPQ